MSNNKVRWLGVLLLVGLAVSAVWLWPRYVVSSSMNECLSEPSPDLQIECVFNLIEREVQRKGVSGGTKIFSLAYQKIPSFANGGCHERAHRLGDIAYYQLYLQGGLDAIDFPQETTACGYGFFHGLAEHITQDNPTPEFITQTCERLSEQLGERMGRVRSICYHDAGHGLLLAWLENIPGESWGDISVLVSEPAARCSELTAARESDIEQCYEGIFTVLTSAMILSQYGLTYNRNEPYKICTKVPAYLHKACAYETSQKLDNLSGFDAKRMIEIISALPSESDRLMAFGVGIGGLIQGVVATEGGYQGVLANCSGIEAAYYQVCVRSIAWGLFEHGEPQREYKKALEFCEETDVLESGLRDFCYDGVAWRLHQFYEPARIREICLEFPVAYRTSCAERKRS